MRAPPLAVLAAALLLTACAATSPPAPAAPTAPGPPQIFGSADRHVIAVEMRLADADRTLVADALAILPDAAPSTFGLTGTGRPAAVPGISGTLRAMADGSGVRFELALSLARTDTGPLEPMDARADAVRVIAVARSARLLPGESLHHAVDADTGSARRVSGRPNDPGLRGAELVIRTTLLRRADLAP